MRKLLIEKYRTLEVLAVLAVIGIPIIGAITYVTCFTSVEIKGCIGIWCVSLGGILLHTVLFTFLLW